MLRAQGSAFLQRNSNSSKPNICAVLWSFHSLTNFPCKNEPRLTVLPLTSVPCMTNNSAQNDFRMPKSNTHHASIYVNKLFRNLVERILFLSSSGCTAPPATVCISPDKVLLGGIFFIEIKIKAFHTLQRTLTSCLLEIGCATQHGRKQKAASYSRWSPGNTELQKWS